MNGCCKRCAYRWPTVITLTLITVTAQAIPLAPTNTTEAASASGTGTDLFEPLPEILPGFFLQETFSDVDVGPNTASAQGSVTGANAQADATVLGEVNSEAFATTPPVGW